MSSCHIACLKRVISISKLFFLLNFQIAVYPWDWQNRSLQFLFAFKKISLALTQGITVAQKHKGQIIYISLNLISSSCLMSTNRNRIENGREINNFLWHSCQTSTQSAPDGRGYTPNGFFLRNMCSFFIIWIMSFNMGNNWKLRKRFFSLNVE